MPQLVSPALSDFEGPIRNIGEAVLNFKKDIKFHRSAENRVGAAKYATQHNLVLGPDEDINGDGINDVVLYKKDGTPVMINGYTYKDSEMPYRIKYSEDYPSKFDKTKIGGYTGFMKSFRSNEPEMMEFLTQLPQGYARKKLYKPRKPTLYQDVSKVIRENIKTILEMHFEESDKTWIIKKFPYMKAIGFLFVDVVLSQLWIKDEISTLKQEIMSTANTPEARLSLFKQRLNSALYKKWYSDELSSQAFKQYLSQSLQPSNMDYFLENVCGFANDNIAMLPNDNEVKTDLDAKAITVGFMDATGERIDYFKNNTVQQVFSK